MVGDLPRLYMLLLNVARVLKDDVQGDIGNRRLQGQHGAHPGAGGQK